VADRIITFAELVGKKMSSPAMHQKMYPDGIAAEINLYHGTHINAPSFVKVAESVDGYGEQVTDPEKLQDVLKRGLEANRSGKPAISDVIVA
jgi:thiamine pyrophosphate-dependent acetolactate synthase large subunit-like protein